MTNLEWNVLAAKFYEFKNEASKFGFYVPELNNMEHSLDVMRPFKETQDIQEKVETGLESHIQEKTEDKGADMAAWVFSKFSIPPTYDKDDNLVLA